MPASVQIPRTSAPEQLPIFSASARKLIPRWRDICRRGRRGELLKRKQGPRGQSHLARVDTQNRDTSLRARWRELDLAVDAAWSEESGVEDVWRKGRGDSQGAEGRC